VEDRECEKIKSVSKIRIKTGSKYRLVDIQTQDSLI